MNVTHQSIISLSSYMNNITCFMLNSIYFTLDIFGELCVTFGTGGPLQLEQFHTNLGSPASWFEIAGLWHSWWYKFWQVWHSISLLPFPWLSVLQIEQHKSFKPSRSTSKSNSSADEFPPDGWSPWFGGVGVGVGEGVWDLLNPPLHL